MINIGGMILVCGVALGILILLIKLTDEPNN